ncbi:hypothetical protein P175DRAFT_0472692 [Aspergillus ochraceoroseus IBT 24754]|uniref:Uncharacterized protein n=1 Tax=Aspergillus ochraceoroseus IBT 24754 TaxID=1392256 RepID=A0A2T5MA42_9EURO|nr:uncharacterized protein P175DRAFT_0472692 [Aspergillus ochraceoroseus IBT 24754]PTU25409.1 hypothetical protein P175DRAFT_0472692 [Aspergillus ochraceoroseus IBT 24754]
MSLRWRKRSQWPPSPSVEDELDSLSRELYGLAYLGELPGIEGVHARGTIDQCPLILDVEILIVSQVFSNVEEKTAPGPKAPNVGARPQSPKKDSRKDRTHKPLYPGENQIPGPGRNLPLRNPRRPQDALPQQPRMVPKQVPEDRKAPATSSRPLPPGPPPLPIRPDLPVRDYGIRKGTLQPKPMPAVPPPAQKAPPPAPLASREMQRKASSSMPKRSESVKYTRTLKSISVDPRSSSPGYLSDSGAIRHKQGSDVSNRSPPPDDRKPPLSPALSVAERLEEKIKRRREERESGNLSDPQISAPLPQIQAVSVPKSSSPEIPSLSATHQAAHPTQPQELTAPKKPAVRSISLDREKPIPAHQNRRRAVSFAEKPVEQPTQILVVVEQETTLTQLQPPRQEGSANSSRSTSPSGSLSLSPCPRSLPVAGYQDWHTIQGLNHLDICPSCTKQMRKSKFRDRFVLSAPKPRTELVRCSMSEPWTRLAWVQTLKKKLDHLDLLFQITRPPPGSKPCTGRIINDQHWYRVVDNETGLFLPQFNVCSACVRNVRLLMPEHRETFARSSIILDRVCDFVTDSPRFIRYIDGLDLSANRAEQKDAPPDLSEFLAYARRKVVLRDCRRSRLVLNTWHYMPQRPEFTVCEDCYDDIVWPLAKGRFPIARQFSTVMRLLPGETGPSSTREASCQLYSPRLRAKFNDAVRRNDMPYLNWVALKRYEAEQRFRDRQEELHEDERRGYDCSIELRKNFEEWKRWE